MSGAISVYNRSITPSVEAQSVVCVCCRLVCVARTMLSLLHASMLHASPAEPGQRPARPHGKQVATTHTRGEHLHAGRSTFRRSAPTAVERGAVRGMHRPTPVGRFSWDALNVTNATQCAGKKCYFPSQREGEGWLVGQPSRCLRPECRDAAGQLLYTPNQTPDMAPPTHWFPQYSRAWALAEELRAGFGVDHLMRGPPLLATLPQAQATYINAMIKALDRKKRPTNPRKWKIENATQTQYFAAGSHPVQGVRSCSYPECMLLKCVPLKAQAIEGFATNAPNKTKLSQGIQQSFVLVAAMVKAHPCLKHDFQVFLRNDGAVLNIDLDRCDELTPGTREPLNASQTLALAQIPDLCQKGSDQVFLDKALGQLYERLRQNRHLRRAAPRPVGLTGGPGLERRLPQWGLLHDAPQPARLPEPRHVYDSLRNQTDVADASEAVHIKYGGAARSGSLGRRHHPRGTDYDGGTQRARRAQTAELL